MIELGQGTASDFVPRGQVPLDAIIQPVDRQSGSSADLLRQLPDNAGGLKDSVNVLGRQSRVEASTITAPPNKHISPITPRSARARFNAVSAATICSRVNLD